MTVTNARGSAAFEAWKQADARAREKECELAAAWAAYHEKRSGPPEEALFAEVARFRSVALQKLTGVLDEIKRATGQATTSRIRERPEHPS